jgi:hypothetical protein
VKLVLYPLALEPARGYQKALFDASIPATAFITKDIQALKQRGVVFHGDPQKNDLITAVLFEDTCGNLINLVQPELLIKKKRF